MSRDFTGRPEENKNLVGEVGVPAKVLSEHLPNTNLKHYRYTKTRCDGY
jgi:hypothetical protein